MNIPKEEKDKFNAEKVKCLVCKAVVDEFNYEIAKVDPDKKVEKIGSFRIKADGNTDSKVVSQTLALDKVSRKRHMIIVKHTYYICHLIFCRLVLKSSLCF